MSHIVTVTTRLKDARREVHSVKLKCTSPADADCRRYPDCDCEWWVWNDDKTADQYGHPRESGQECVLEDWFEAGGAVYDGDDGDDLRDDYVPAIDRYGTITYDWEDEYVTWNWEGDS